MSRILVIDDENAICWGLEKILSQAGHQIRTAATAEQGLELSRTFAPELVLLDYRLPGRDGLSAIQDLSKLPTTPAIILMTAFGDLNTAVSAFQQGVVDYLTKPFELKHVLQLVERTLQSRAQPHTSTLPKSQLTAELLGSCPAMQEVFKRIAIVAPTDASVLITGESGTGKELVARAIHAHSLLNDQPFVPVNLAALSPTIVESELFGHVRGAFTGAESAKTGLLELAHQGTVLFDEAADIPLPVQVKLLRVLEQHEVLPVGSAIAKPAKFRVICATNRNLRQECTQGNFRQDLFYRLSVFEIHLPPLRERVQDIPLLAQAFAERIQQRTAQRVQIADETIRELQQRRWLGNVRELRNAIEHAALMSRGEVLLPNHLPPLIDDEQDNSLSVAEVVKSWTLQQLSAGLNRDLYLKFQQIFEPPLLQTVLDQMQGNKVAAAECLGLHRATLRRKLQMPED
jgi:two-component system, NtrC family, nitrogen regulation response regulator GlnG